MIETIAVDTVMRALADPTRRAVFERIAGSSEISVGELTRGSGVTQGAVSQHLKSLRQAGLVAERPEGRNVFYRAVPDGLTPLRDWLSFYERFWTSRLDVLEGLLRQDDERSKSDRNKSNRAKRNRKRGDDR
jgi:DNA-binding transcriptional ArsR family regulator